MCSLRKHRFAGSGSMHGTPARRGERESMEEVSVDESARFIFFSRCHVTFSRCDTCLAVAALLLFSRAIRVGSLELSRTGLTAAMTSKCCRCHANTHQDEPESESV